MGQSVPASLARIGIVANEPLQRAGLLALLEERGNLAVVTGRSDLLLQDSTVTHLVVDISDQKNPLSQIEAFYKSRPDIRYILLGGLQEERQMTASLFLGVRGCLPADASPEDIVKMVMMVVEGSIWLPRRVIAGFIEHILGQLHEPKKSRSSRLTDRERQVLELLANACSNREIAKELGIQSRTVKAYITRLMEKTGSSSRLGLTMYAANHLSSTTD